MAWATSWAIVPQTHLVTLKLDAFRREAVRSHRDSRPLRPRLGKKAFALILGADFIYKILS
jgi:hypothetical protein